jgi:uncharacterized protein (TIGR02001 family)
MKTKLFSLVALAAISTSLNAGGDIAPVEPAVTPVVMAPVATETTSDFTTSANLALTSNYVWRGMTQTSNSPAVQGGIDLGYKGLYAGVWGSNIDFGTQASLEADLYGGYKGELLGVGYDAGYIIYTYPHDSTALNFEEVYFGLSKSIGDLGLNAKYYKAIQAAGDPKDYWEGGASYALPAGFGLAASYGDYEDIGSNYKVGVTKAIGKFTAGIAYTDFQGDLGFADEDHIVGTISTTF